MQNESQGKAEPANAAFTLIKVRQGAYKFGKMKFPEFFRFSRPSVQLFPDNYKEKTRRNELT